MGRQRYDREFKVNAIKLVLEQGMPCKQASEDLGVGFSTLNKWIAKFQKDPQHAFPGKGYLRPQDEELRKLRREVTNLRMERDILKKAIPILAALRKKSLNA